MANYEIRAALENLHGYFSRDLSPILSVDSGDSVTYYNIPDAAYNSRCKRFDEDVPEKIPRRDPSVDTGHCLLGPVWIREARPGDVLEIKIGEILPAEYGWTSSGGWPHEIHKRLGLTELPEANLFWQLSGKEQTARNQLGHVISMKPFMGVMGMPSNISGIQPTPPPRRTGGNLDCKELVLGTSLFLPIEVEGGLFSTGDGHAAQGDGEVCVTAIECPMERVKLTFVLHPKLEFGMPRARTATKWITLGFDRDLDEAVFLALEEMINLIVARLNVDRKHALALASVAVDVRVTQIVNGVKGAHAVLRDDAIRNLETNSHQLSF